MDDPSRVDLIDGVEADVVAGILAAHPARNMELWQCSKLVRILGPRPPSGFLAHQAHRPSRRRG